MNVIVMHCGARRLGVVRIILVLLILAGPFLDPAAAKDEPPVDPTDKTAGQSDDDSSQLPVVRAKIAVTGSFPESPAFTVIDGDQIHSGRIKDAGDLLRVAGPGPR